MKTQNVNPISDDSGNQNCVEGRAARRGKVRETIVKGGAEKGLMSHSTQFRSFRRRCFTGLMTKPTVSKHWRRVV